MFEETPDGGVTEDELECILHTALGVTELRVSRLFRAVDVEHSGKVTFGKRAGSVTASAPAVCEHEACILAVTGCSGARRRQMRVGGAKTPLIASLYCYLFLPGLVSPDCSLLPRIATVL